MIFRRALCFLLFAMPVHAQELVPAKFEFRPVSPAEGRDATHPDLELRVTYAGPMLREQTRVYLFQLHGLERYQSASEIRDYRTTYLGEWVDGVTDLFKNGDDAPPILIPREGLGRATDRIAGVENGADGRPRYVDEGEWQIRVAYPQEEEDDFSFRIEYESVHFGLAPGWCYINGESAATNPQGQVVDKFHWWERGSVKTYRIEADPKTGEPVLRAVDYDSAPFHTYPIPDETKRPEGG